MNHILGTNRQTRRTSYQLVPIQPSTERADIGREHPLDRKHPTWCDTIKGRRPLMNVWGLLVFDESVEAWYGRNDTHEVVVSREAMLAAYVRVLTDARAAPDLRHRLYLID